MFGTTQETSIDLLAQLKNLIRNLDRKDITSVQTLLSKVIGNRNAALMCMQLLYWLPRSTNDEGWVYKSWRDWEAECDLSRSQVKRIHAANYLENIGFTRKIMKVSGAPTSHYRLDRHQFVFAIAMYLDVSSRQINAWMQEPKEVSETHQTSGAKPTHPMAQNRPMEWARTHQSLTTDYRTESYIQTTLQNLQQGFSVFPQKRGLDVMTHLEQMGSHPKQAQKLLRQHGEQRIFEVMCYAQTKNTRNIAGYIVQALKQNWTLPYASNNKH